MFPRIIFVLVLLLAYADKAKSFPPGSCFVGRSTIGTTSRRMNSKAAPRLLFGFSEAFSRLFDKEELKSPFPKKDNGEVVRLGARRFNSTTSMPSSRGYTTRKNGEDSIDVTESGVQGDYNHYRTKHLNSTADRALSILTADVMKSARSKFPTLAICDGDFGENVLVEGVEFDYFVPGEKYLFQNTGGDAPGPNQGEWSDEDSVVVEITEPMEPCANLCTLHYINDSGLEPRARIARCSELLKFLGRSPGFRGWYAKVLRGGRISIGTKVIRIVED